MRGGRRTWILARSIHYAPANREMQLISPEGYTRDETLCRAAMRGAQWAGQKKAAPVGPL